MSDVASDAAAVTATGSSATGASLRATHAANWPMILSATSEITPRPNCAGFPVIVMSVTMVTAVLSGPSAATMPVTVAFAVPLPRESRPLASITTSCAASSRET